MKARIVYRVDTRSDEPAEQGRALLAQMVNAGALAMKPVSVFAEITCERTELASDPWVLERRGERVELSRREKEIAVAIVAGLRRGEIAEQCDIQASTFDTHRLNVMRLMGCANEVQLTRLAIAKGWVQL